MPVQIDPALRSLLTSYRDSALDDAQRVTDMLKAVDAALADGTTSEDARDTHCLRLMLACQNASRTMSHYFTQKEWAERLLAHAAEPAGQPKSAA